MEIIAYTMSGCSSCGTLKKLFNKASVNYTECLLNRDINISEFKEKYPHVTSFPFVVIDSNEIGGLIETAKLFLEKELVSSKKK